jgi:hypothetical protein
VTVNGVTSVSPQNALIENPAAQPASDPLVEVAGRDAVRGDASTRLPLPKGLTGSDSGISDVVLIGFAAVLPIVAAIVLGGFSDTRRRLQRLVHRER